MLFSLTEVIKGFQTTGKEQNGEDFYDAQY